MSESKESIEALLYTQKASFLYTQKASFDPNRSSHTFSFKEIHVGEPYNMVINYAPDDMYSGNNELHMFRAQNPRLIINPSFSSTPEPVMDAQKIQVPIKWIADCFGLMVMQETTKSITDTLRSAVPDELKNVSIETPFE
jgi:hypothetical protein